jgi:3-deoxy-D-manno-octulosonic-acid transferase
LAVFFYNIFISLFRAAIIISSPWNAKAKKWSEGRKNIFPKIKSALNSNQSPIIWIHCSSVGEFEQGRPIIERIKTQNSTHKIFLTFFSPSGYEANKNYKEADFIFYLPMDSAENAKKFLNLVNPLFVIWVKYDYWFYYLKEIHKRKINCILISAVFRKQQSFFKWYGSLQRKMVSCFTHLFVQNKESKELLKTIGIENCTVSGDSRFDRVIEIAERFEPIPSIEQFIGASKSIVAGSTWKEDEEALKKAFDEINDPDLKLIIAPHEVGITRIEGLKTFFPHSQKFSQLTSNQQPVTGNILIIDNIGMLSRLYNYGYITYVGGGFTNDGVHNVLEAAVYGKPVIYGPNYIKYREAVELIAEEGGQCFSVPEELHDILISLLKKENEWSKNANASKNYVYKNKGATEKILQHIQEKRLLTS